MVLLVPECHLGRIFFNEWNPRNRWCKTEDPWQTPCVHRSYPQSVQNVLCSGSEYCPSTSIKEWAYLIRWGMLLICPISALHWWTINLIPTLSMVCTLSFCTQHMINIAMWNDYSHPLPYTLGLSSHSLPIFLEWWASDSVHHICMVVWIFAKHMSPKPRPSMLCKTDAGMECGLCISHKCIFKCPVHHL